jgi:hypothetical protein
MSQGQATQPSTGVYVVSVTPLPQTVDEPTSTICCCFTPKIQEMMFGPRPSVEESRHERLKEGNIYILVQDVTILKHKLSIAFTCAFVIFFQILLPIIVVSGNFEVTQSQYVFSSNDLETLIGYTSVCATEVCKFKDWQDYAPKTYNCIILFAIAWLLLKVCGIVRELYVWRSRFSFGCNIVVLIVVAVIMFKTINEYAADAITAFLGVVGAEFLLQLDDMFVLPHMRNLSEGMSKFFSLIFFVNFHLLSFLMEYFFLSTCLLSAPKSNLQLPVVAQV